MGFKDLFIEKEETEEEEIDLNALSAGLGEYSAEPEIEVAEINEDSTDIIAETYEKNNLTDLANSIFKVEELSNTLPKEMVTETKRATVASIMQTVGLSVETAVDDASTRSYILGETLGNLSKKLSEENSEAEAKIEELKKAIADNEALIANNKETMKVSTEKITAEVERINNLVKFIKGE